MKKILLLLLCLLLLAGGMLFWTLSSKKSLITPFPYSFNTKASTELKNELKDAENASIIILGDRMGEALNNYTGELEESLASQFKTPPKIYNWSRPHEGLHRSLFKLKSLNKFPPVIIYLGASSELFEKRFDMADKDAILKNFSFYDNEKIISLIITFPWLSKIVYKKMHYFNLGEIKEYQNHLAGLDKMNEKELAFKLFDYELRELTELVKDKKSNLILITTPLNLEVPPKETCALATSNAIVELQQELEEHIRLGNYKNAYPIALELANETYSNASSFYLLGKIALGLGEVKTAREAFQKASIFDCSNWRGNAVYNAIIRKEALKKQIPLIDFDQFMTSSLSKEGLFIDEIFPQNIFYQTMVQELKETLKKILSVSN